MEPRTIKICNIIPLHEVRDEEKLNNLIESMKENGWTGRPIVVLDIGDIQALTGSHRYAAAKIAGIEEIPCAIVNHGDMFDYYNLSDLNDPDNIRRILEEYDEEAAELFSEEVD